MARIALESAQSAVQKAQELYDQAYPVVAPVVKQAVEKATPVVQDGIKIGSKVAGEAVTAAKPIVSDALKQVTETASSAGIDPKALAPVQTAAKPVVSVAQTAAEKAFTTLTTSPPLVAAEYTLGAVALLYLTPSILGLLGDALRGYRGDISATIAVDRLQVTAAVP